MPNPKMSNSIVNIKQGHSTNILIRKELLRRLLSYKYAKDKDKDKESVLSKPSLIVFFILLLSLEDNFKTISQRELAKKYNMSESSFSRALKWLIDNKIIEVSTELGKQFRFSFTNLPYTENLINDFKENNPNPFFLEKLVTYLKEDMFAISDDDNNDIKQLLDRLRNDDEIGRFIPPPPPKAGEWIGKYEEGLPHTYTEFISLCEKYTNLVDEKKEQIKSYQNIPEICPITQGNQFVLIRKDIIAGIINDFNPEAMYKNTPESPSKAAMYMLLYLLTVMDSYNYYSINQLVLAEQLNVDKSVVSSGLKYLEKAGFIARNPNNKKDWAFVKKYFSIFEV